MDEPLPMSYTLEPWDVLISTTIHPDNLHRFTARTNWQESLLQLSAIQKEKVRSLLVNDFVSDASEKKIKFLVQFNQGILIRLLDKLHDYKKEVKVAEVKVLYEGISEDVNYILHFIEEYFHKYFDRSEKVPGNYLQLSKEEINRQHEELKQLFSRKKFTGHEVATMIHSNFNHFCADENNACNYEGLLYQKELVKELLKVDVSSTANFSEAIHEVLTSLNFNSPAFTAYLLHALQLQNDQSKGVKDKVKMLLHSQNKLSLILSRSSPGLYPGHPSVKEILLDATEKELQYMQVVPGEKSKDIMTDEKSLVHVQFKGTEIYLFHKAFIDAGGAPGETYKSILEKTAARLSNKNRKGFSVESLQKNSDKVDYDSKENLKRFLQKMIRNIDSY